MLEQNVPRLYSLEDRAKSLTNSDRFCDVLFLVGQEKVLVRGHKVILALGRHTGVQSPKRSGLVNDPITAS